MRTIYLDCGMGAAGDMLTAALLELLADPEDFLRQMKDLGLPDVEVNAEKCVKCGIVGTRMVVKVHGQEEGDCHEHHHEHHHSSLRDVAHILSHLNLPEQVRGDVMAVYRLIAEAESHVHGVPVSDIHFHEVGTLDAIADVTGVCLLMHMLKPEKVVASAVHVGSGTVRCAHGSLPVPAPAAAYILRDVPIYGGQIRGELCTPTGAALLKYFVTEFGEMPPMSVSKIGYGMGKKDFAQANCLRAMLGRCEDRGERLIEFSCNVDDMTGEAIGFAMEQLLENGALDAYTVAVGMKKSRPGTMICALCPETVKEKLVRVFFRHTTTLGLRETVCKRYALERKTVEIDTEFGIVRRKDSAGFGVVRSKYEYEDLAKAARAWDMGLEETVCKIQKGQNI